MQTHFLTACLLLVTIIVRREINTLQYPCVLITQSSSYIKDMSLPVTLIMLGLVSTSCSRALDILGVIPSCLKKEFQI